LWPNAQVADALATAARRAHADCGGRIMGRDSVHLTLAFLGDIPADRVVAAETIGDSVHGESFTLHIDRLGFWKHNHILWAGCSDTPFAMANLVRDLDEGLRGAEFSLEARTHAAHVTLLRDAHCAVVPRMDEIIVWPIGEFALIESTPMATPRYRPIRRWLLKSTS
jgi:2'-5' RNA ligase